MQRGLMLAEQLCTMHADSVCAGCERVGRDRRPSLQEVAAVGVPNSLDDECQGRRSLEGLGRSRRRLRRDQECQDRQGKHRDRESS